MLSFPPLHHMYLKALCLGTIHFLNCVWYITDITVLDIIYAIYMVFVLESISLDSEQAGILEAFG